MANAFNQDPMVLDTVWTAGSMPAAFLALTSPQQFSRIVWEGGTAADVIIITDINGNVIFTDTCPVTGQDVVLWDNNGKKKIMKQNGWILTQMPHGKLLLFK